MTNAYMALLKLDGNHRLLDLKEALSVNWLVTVKFG